MYRISDQGCSSEIPVIEYSLLQTNKMSPKLVLPQFPKDLNHISSGIVLNIMLADQRV